MKYIKRWSFALALIGALALVFVGLSYSKPVPNATKLCALWQKSFNKAPTSAPTVIVQTKECKWVTQSGVTLDFGIALALDGTKHGCFAIAISKDGTLQGAEQVVCHKADDTVLNQYIQAHRGPVA